VDAWTRELTTARLPELRAGAVPGPGVRKRDAAN
jgi:hypothetical protein